MLTIEGHVFRDGKYWLVEAVDLDVMTQGRSRTDALAMIKDAIELLIDKPGFEITINKGKKERFTITAKDAKTLIGFMLKRQRSKWGLTLKQVAENMGAKSINAYAQYEQGRVEPSLSKLQELLCAINPEIKAVLKTAS